jgi:hypothetical protein
VLKSCAVLSSDLAVSALDIDDEELLLAIDADIDAFGGLIASSGCIQDIEVGMEKQIQKSALAGTLAAYDGNGVEVGAADLLVSNELLEGFTDLGLLVLAFKGD